MLDIAAHIYQDSEELIWVAIEREVDVNQVNLFITLDDHYSDQQATELLKEKLELCKVSWFIRDKYKWFINLDKLKELDFVKERSFTSSILNTSEKGKRRTKLKYLGGLVELDLEVKLEEVGVDRSYNSVIVSVLSEREIIERRPKKVFLSHKGTDKEIVREYNTILKLLGFDTWLDEETMVAGVELNRALLKGFKQSCASIFFITSNYVDEDFLGTEIDYAVTEKRERKSNFQIITIVLPGHHDKYEIPALLKPFIWKTPKTHLEGLQEIIKALPIVVSDPVFRS